MTYNAKFAVTYELYLPNEDGSFPDLNDAAVEAKPAYSGVAVAAADTTTSEQQLQEFTIENVPAGTYMLVIKKQYHLSVTIKGIVVGDSDVTLRTTGDTTSDDDTYLVLCAGDMNENGAVNVADLNMVIASGTYGATYEDAENKCSDIDGSGSITVTDRNIVTSSDNYGKANSDFVFDAINAN
jgi:hypothetical protein